MRQILAIVAASALALSMGAVAAATTKAIGKTPTLQALPDPPGHKFRFTLVSMTIDKIRSAHSDSDFAMLTITGAGTVEKYLGDVKDGHHRIGLSEVVTLADNANVGFAYKIFNSSGDLPQMLKYLSQYSMEIGIITKLHGPDLGGLLPGGCDGQVAEGSSTLTEGDLAADTAGNKTFYAIDHSAGSDSPVGCGANSSYDVEWSVTAVP